MFDVSERGVPAKCLKLLEAGRCFRRFVGTGFFDVLLISLLRIAVASPNVAGT